MKKQQDHIPPQKTSERSENSRTGRRLGKIARARLAFEEMRASVEPSEEEASRELPGDELISDAELGVNINRILILDGPPEEVWPWVQQVGKRKLTPKQRKAHKEGLITVGERAGWYLPESVEKFLPRKGRGLRDVDPGIQQLEEEDVVPDYAGFGQLVTARVLTIKKPDDTDRAHALVFAGKRGKKNTEWTWALVLEPHADNQTKLQMRIRTGPLNKDKLVHKLGAFFDFAVAVGFEKGLNERLAEAQAKRSSLSDGSL